MYYLVRMLLRLDRLQPKVMVPILSLILSNFKNHTQNTNTPLEKWGHGQPSRAQPGMQTIFLSEPFSSFLLTPKNARVFSWQRVTGKKFAKYWEQLVDKVWLVDMKTQF